MSSPAVPIEKKKPGCFGRMMQIYRGIQIVIAVLVVSGLGILLIVLPKLLVDEPGPFPIETEAQAQLVGVGMLLFSLLATTYWIARVRAPESKKTVRLEGFFNLLIWGGIGTAMGWKVLPTAQSIYAIETRGVEATAKLRWVGPGGSGWRKANITVQGEDVSLKVWYRRLVPREPKPAAKKRTHGYGFQRKPQSWKDITVLTVPGKPNWTIHSNSQADWDKRVGAQIDDSFIGFSLGLLACLVLALLSLKTFIAPRVPDSR